MMLKPEQVVEIVKIKDDDITKELMLRMFGITDPKVGPKFRPNDAFILEKGMIENYTDKSTCITTIGRYLFNVFLNVGCFGSKFPYFNSENFLAFDELLDNALIEGKIQVKPEYSMYQTKRSWLEYTIVEILVPGLSFNLLHPNPIVAKRKKELFQQYKEQLDAGDVTVAAAIEKELLALAKEVNKDDPGLRLYNLKKPSFGNNYKNMTIMVGAQASNSNPGKFSITDTCYMEGIEKKEYHNFADQLISGSYNRSVETQKGGADTKEFQAALQTITINTDKKSDCHTKLYSKLTLSKDNIKMYRWKNVMNDDGSYTLITPETENSFIGKPLKIRSTQYCADGDMCAVCAGSLYPALDMRDAGLTSAIVPVTVQQIAMKSMHDATIRTNEMQFELYFKDY